MPNLNDSWTLWAHLPQNNNWDIHSYIKIDTTNTVEHTLALTKELPPPLIENCMLFFMKNNTLPMWEDTANKNGGCFSYKVSNEHVSQVWTDLTYSIAGNNISNNDTFKANVTGITVSPKKKFCIVKIWMTNCIFQNPSLIININNLNTQGCLFKKHGS